MGDQTTARWLLSTIVDSLYSTLLGAWDRLGEVFLGLLHRVSVQADSVDYTLIVMAACLLMAGLVAGGVSAKLIGHYEDKVMQIFIDMPRKYVVYLNSQCENFISELQSAEKRNAVDELSDEDVKTEAQDDEVAALKSDKAGFQRVFTHKKSFATRYLVSFVVLMLLAQGYFVLQFVLRTQFYNRIYNFSAVYHTAHKDLDLYLEVLNVYREYYAAPDNDIGRHNPLRLAVLNEWQKLYAIEKLYFEVPSIINE